MTQRSALLVLGLLLSASVVAGAAEPSPDKPTPTPTAPKQPDNKNKNAYPPAVDHSASIKARKEIVAAKAAVEKAESGLTTTVADLKKRVENSPEWTAAKSNLLKASNEYEQAKAPALEKLGKDPQYQSAKARKTKAEADRDALGDNRGTPQYMQAATTVLNASSEVTKLEGQTLTSDPQVAGAHQRMLDANTRVTELNKKFEASIKTDPQWKAARKALDDATARVTAANAALPPTLQTEAAAEKKRDQEVADLNRRKAEEEAARNARQRRVR